MPIILYNRGVVLSTMYFSPFYNVLLLPFYCPITFTNFFQNSSLYPHPYYINQLTQLGTPLTLFYRSLGNKLCVTGLYDSTPLRMRRIHFHTLLSFSKSAADLMILHLRLTYFFSLNAFGKGQTHLLEKHVSL